MMDRTKRDVLMAFALSRLSKQPKDGTLSDTTRSAKCMDVRTVQRVAGFDTVEMAFTPVGKRPTQTRVCILLSAVPCI